MIVGIVLGLAAVIGTVVGLFLGMPIAGFVLWPVTSVVCRICKIPTGHRLDDHPVVRIESALAAGLGMALGVSACVGLVGALIGATQAWAAATNAGAVAGLTFGPLWKFGFTRESATPLLVSTAALAGLAAALSS